jgi:hypothetical protein
MDTGPTGVQEPATGSAPLTNAVSLDTLLPTYETQMEDAVTIARPRAEVWAAFERLKASDMPLANVLGTIRAVPLALRQRLARREREATAAPAEEQTFFEAMGNGESWVLLAREPERELTLGLIGKFWQTDMGFRPMRDREQFIAFDEPDYAKIVTTFRMEDIPGGTALYTQTRVHTTDEAAARKFNRYWRVIRPGAGFTVRSMLNAVKRRAEAPAGGQAPPITIQQPSQIAGFIALTGSLGLLARVLYLTFSGAPTRLRPIPRLLLFAEIAVSSVSVALNFWAWVLSPFTARQRREARVQREEGPPAALVESATRYGARFGASLGQGMWSLTLIIHAIRVAIYFFASNHGLKSDE